MPKTIFENEIIKICAKITNQNHIDPSQTYNEILDLENYPERLNILISKLQKEFNIDLNNCISGGKTPATTVIFFEKRFQKPKPVL